MCEKRAARPASASVAGMLCSSNSMLRARGHGHVPRRGLRQQWQSSHQMYPPAYSVTGLATVMVGVRSSRRYYRMGEDSLADFEGLADAVCAPAAD